MRYCPTLKRSVLRSTALFFIGAVSSFFRALGWRACRFHPSCSQYARQAYTEIPFLKASYISARRILRCHPFSAGGFDPVPSPLKKEC